MGRNSRWPLIESTLRIDIRELKRPSPGKPRGIFSHDVQGLSLGLGFQPSGAEVLLSFSFGETYSSMRLRYHTDGLGDRSEWLRWPEAIDETITLQRFPQPFGGHRWYFLCPTANRRCQVLYLPRGASRFRSRWAFRCRFQYHSQRLSPPWRYKHRAERIAKQVLNRGSVDFRNEYEDYEFPPKPPWMRWRTYNRLDEAAQAYDDAGEALLDERLYRWIKRLGMNDTDELYSRALGKKK